MKSSLSTNNKEHFGLGPNLGLAKFDNALENVTTFYNIRKYRLEMLLRIWAHSFTTAFPTSDFISKDEDQPIIDKLHRLKAAKDNIQAKKIESKPLIETTALPRKEGSSLANERFQQLSKLASITIQASHGVETNGSLKDLILKLRMTINRKVVQIANSFEQVSAIVREFLILFNDPRVRAIPGLQEYCFCTAAKKLVNQGEMLVSTHLSSAFPIAQVIVDVGVNCRPFIPIFLFYLMDCCPLAIPSAPDTKTRLNSEGDCVERICGLISLLGAIVQTNPSLQCENPFGLENGWLWLASMLNLAPQYLTPFVLHAFLETAGFSLWRRYRERFLQLLMFIKKDYIPRLPRESIAGTTRLELYIDLIFSRSPPRIDPPSGTFSIH